MKRDYYVTPKPSFLMRLFWKAAGGDRYLLERASYSDQIKYLCLGGIIIATGVMAALAGGYAFYTIFGPKDADGALEISPIHVVLATTFGIIWGLIIFNIDRFIVTSTGTGDGTEKITWDEFKGAIPRIIMGIIIAITISKPLEIRIFQTEIQAKLIEKKQAQENTYKGNVIMRTAPQIRKDSIDIKSLKDDIEKNRINYETAFDMAKSACPNGGLKCPVATHRELWNHANEVKNTYRNAFISDSTAIASLELDIKSNKEKQAIDLSKAQKDGESLDGLLERISISHEIGGWTSVFITLLFLSIELTPIFFKLMLIKSPYDYISDNVKELIKAEHGIYVEKEYFKDRKGADRDLVVNIEKEKMIHDKKEIMEAQKRLTAYAIAKYEDDMRKKIDENPNAFIKISEPSKP